MEIKNPNELTLGFNLLPMLRVHMAFEQIKNKYCFNIFQMIKDEPYNLLSEARAKLSEWILGFYFLGYWVS